LLQKGSLPTSATFSYAHDKGYNMTFQAGLYSYNSINPVTYVSTTSTVELAIKLLFKKILQS